MLHDGSFAAREGGERLLRQGKRLFCKPCDGVPRIARKVFHARQQFKTLWVVNAILLHRFPGDHCRNARRCNHRICNAPFIEPCCNIPVWGFRTILADIRHFVRRAAILCRPLGNELALRIEFARNTKQLPVLSTGGIFSAAHIIGCKDERIRILKACAAKRKRPLLRIDIRA